MKKIPFDVWWEELKLYAKAHEYPIDDETKETWREYYDDDYSAKEALDEDMSYADWEPKDGTQ
jgi:hypothetical protein